MWQTRLVALISASLFLMSCASSNTEIVSAGVYSGPPIRTIALLPGGGVLGDAISLNLIARAFQIVPPPTDASEASLRSSEGLASLRRSGIDALLVVRSTNDHDGRTRSATALLYSTDSGRLVSGATWENGHGFGIEHSVTNSVLRVGNDKAAKEIVEQLIANVPR